MIYSNNKSIFNNRFFVIMCSVALILVLAIGITFAWLSDLVTEEGDATIGEVAIEIYNNGEKINGSCSRPFNGWMCRFNCRNF